MSLLKNNTQLINASEAHNLWDLLKLNYLAVELMQIWENYAHDTEFKVIIQAFINDIKKDIVILEKQMMKFSIQGPNKHRASVNTAANTEVLYDETIAQEFFLFAQENIEQLLRGIRTSTTNDGVRTLIMNFTHKAIDRMDKLAGYLTIKGWVDTPPMYLQATENTSGQITAGGAYHLWDHLTFRYDNISQTEIYHAFAKDKEFKTVLKVGLERTLRKQAEKLEKELNRFGIPLPIQPKQFAMSQDTEALEDDHMYRTLLSGIQGAAIFHAQALKQITLEDSLRKLFKQLLLEELDYIDDLIKFGNLKGWLHPVPQYKTN